MLGVGALFTLTVEPFERSQQLVWGGGEVAIRAPVALWIAFKTAAPAPQMPVPDALAAERAAMRIGLIQKHDIHRAHIGVHRDVVARQILIDE